MSIEAGPSLVRAYHLIECKWSQDKPWVVFSERRGIHSNAAVAQTIASKVGHSALWVLAPDQRLHTLSCFRIAERNGFSGRQAFSNNQDQFYSAVQSIVEKSVAIAEFYDDYEYDPRKTMMCVVAFPVVVISAPLFEAYYDELAKQVRLSEADHIRVLWRGAGKWTLHAVVDIVKDTAFESFAKERRKDTECLLRTMKDTVEKFHTCLDQRSIAPLSVQPGPRGVLGPPYIVELINKYAAATPPGNA
jgi:hypothetical protein